MTQVISQITDATYEKDQTALATVVDLFRALNRRGVRYCHWKSNLRLQLGLSGLTDLDLLVDYEQGRAFKQVLKELKVRPVLARPGKRYSAIEDYLGFDSTTGKLFHLHVHYQLVLGEQFVKNYRLPLEELFLDSVRLHHGVNIPAPELELIVLSLRALLKYRDRDALKDMLSIRSAGIPKHILDEVHWLLGQTSIPAVSNVLALMSAVIPAHVVLDFLQTVTASPRTGYSLYRLRGKVRRALRPYQRHDRFRASFKYFQELWRRRQSFLRFRPGRGMTLPGGGVTVAVVGGDGAGKTTLSQELARWLSWKMDVRLYYLGSKQPSWLSKRLYLLFRIARQSHRTFSGRFGEKNAVSRLIVAARQVLLYSHYLSIGIDRYRRHRAGRQFTRNGSIVVYDRFPLVAPLDGPQIHLAADGHQGIIANSFSRLEKKLYRRFQTPDLLVALEVSPEVSIRRKPDHRREVIEAKNQTLSKLSAGIGAGSAGGHWAHLNADLPFDDVLGRLKKEIWQATTNCRRS